MKFSTGQRRRSRLQGHRKRRRKLKALEGVAPNSPEVDWMEYKTMRQYPSMGEMLDQMRQYGYRGGIESIMERSWNPEDERFQDFTAEEFTRKTISQLRVENKRARRGPAWLFFIYGNFALIQQEKNKNGFTAAVMQVFFNSL